MDNVWNGFQDFLIALIFIISMDADMHHYRVNG